MRCRVCQRNVSGDSAPVLPLVCSSAYALMVNCGCGASLCFTMWLSEAEAVQRDYEEQRYQAHRAALTALNEARRSGAARAVIRRLERREERLAYSE